MNQMKKDEAGDLGSNGNGEREGEGNFYQSLENERKFDDRSPNLLLNKNQDENRDEDEIIDENVDEDLKNMEIKFDLGKNSHKSK